jgi:Minor capsid protein
MSKPIPRRLLIHSAALAPYVSPGPPVSYGTSVSLSYVRLEPVKHNAMTSLGEMKDDKFLLFFDCKNSLPVGRTFAKKDKITFGALILSVRIVTPCYGDDATVHHYEVNCV